MSHDLAYWARSGQSSDQAIGVDRASVGHPAPESDMSTETHPDRERIIVRVTTTARERHDAYPASQFQTSHPKTHNNCSEHSDLYECHGR